MTLREIRSHTKTEILVMVSLLNRLQRFEYGKELHTMAESGRDMSGDLALAYEEYYWTEMDRFIEAGYAPKEKR